MSVKLYHGDCLEVLPTLEANSIDAVVTDPPYYLTQLSRNGSARQNDPKTPFGRTGLGSKRGGFMNLSWDSGDLAFQPDIWCEVLRVLKPGGHLLAMGGTRTYHRLVCAIEDAGFDIRESVAWVYASGFPKALNISREIDKHLGVEREILGTVDTRGRFDGRERTSSAINTHWRQAEGREDVRDLSKKVISANATPDAVQWSGWHTALKPAHEPIILAQKNYRHNPFISNMIELSDLMEALLWMTLPVKVVEFFSALKQPDYAKAECDSVRWIVAAARGLVSNERTHKMDMLISPAMASTFLNTVTLWNSVLDALWQHGSMFTTEMVSETIIDLKTLKFCISRIMPASIILDGTLANGLWSYASNVDSNLNDKQVGFQYRGIFAAENATVMRGVNNEIAKVAEQISYRLKAIDVNFVPCDAQSSSTTLNAAEQFDTLAQIAEMSSKLSSAESRTTVVENVWHKPSLRIEPICLARKPLIGTVVENVLTHGTGGLNIDACRVPINPDVDDSRLGGKGEWNTDKMARNVYGKFEGTPTGSSEIGRWPANVILDGSDEVLDAFAAYGSRGAAGRASGPSLRGKSLRGSMAGYFNGTDEPQAFYGDKGDAARFFQSCPFDAEDAKRFHFSGKAKKSDRAGSKHPTIKPISLMKYLCKLITPPGGTVLDPFAGSGTTGEAAVLEGFNTVLIEKEDEYVADIRSRLALWL